VTTAPASKPAPLHRRLAAWTIGTAVGSLLLLWSFGWRKNVAALAALDELAKTGKPLLVVIWHGKYFPLLPVVRGRNAAIVTNASFRGMIIGRVCRIFGYSPIHIPVDGSANKMAFIKRALNSGTRLMAIVPDGPLGPRHVVKSGAIRLASEAGFDILPLGVASHPTIVLHKRWDKYEIPPPFARVAITIGRRTEIPADLSNGVQEALQTKVAEIMMETETAAETALLPSPRA